MGFRTTPLLRMQIASGSAVAGVPIPADALSLVIDNPSFAYLLIRWGSTPVDASDPRGYDLVIPGPTLCELPLGEEAGDMVSLDWADPFGSLDAGASVTIDTSGVDIVQIWAKPINPVTFIGLLSTRTPPAPSA